MKTHGYSKTGDRLYSIWSGIRWRVSKNNHTSMSYYDKGIRRCEEWKDFMTFRKWALENGYKDGLTIDRIDNRGDYTPGNCRWVDIKKQANNKSNNHYVTIDGETKTIAEWAREKKINYSTIRSRVNRSKLEGKKILAKAVSKRDKETGRFLGGYEVESET